MSDKGHANLGGAYALAGFLYQAIGVGALAAKIHAVQPRDDGPELRLSIEGDSALTHERFGQDAVIERPGILRSDGVQRRTFVQFKHSHDPLRNKCEPQKLLEIVDGFLGSQRAADEQSKVEADFMLIMNRSLSAEASTMIDNAVNGLADRLLGNPNQKKPARRVLRHLHVVTISGQSLRKQIDNYAAERGILETELDDRLGNLISAIQGLTGGDHEISESWLSMRLTGVDDIRPITPVELQSIMEQALKKLAGNTNIPASVVRRDVADDIEKAILEKPIIVLHGAGGRGKSVIQHQLLSASLCSGKCYVVPTLARGIRRDNWVAHCVQQWRGGSPELPTDTAERAVRRLERARGKGAYPLLLIDIDGLDESVELDPKYQEYVSQVLDLACDQYSESGPKICAVVSCRSIQELERTWPDYEHYQDKFTARIPVSDFSELELRSVVIRSELKNELLPRLPTGSAGLIDGPTRTATGWLERRESTGGERPLPQPILAALRHPLLWGCLVDLERRSDVLNGSQDALQQWAAAYIGRFLKKVKRRHPKFDGLDIGRLLSRVAVAVETKGPAASRDADWIPAAKNGQFDSAEAKTVYREALSFGIIEVEEEGGWRWTHPFVQEYLALGVS